MQGKVPFAQRKAGVALCVVLLVLAQQLCAGPVGPQAWSGPEQPAGSQGFQTLRRVARMSPLWRIMNSKPHGAYCQNNYECSTGLCRAGHCSSSQHGPSGAVNY